MARFDYILHRADGVTTVELNSQVGTFRAVTSERLTAVRQDVSSAELILVSSEAFTVNVGDWIQAKGIRLYCMSTIDKYTCSEDNNREYQLTFYSPEYYLRLAILYNTSESESGGVYSYSRVDNTYPSVGTFEDFVKLCCYNCNSVQGARLFKVGTISEDIATDIRVITFSDYNCLAVMKQSCESFETTWKVRVNEDPEPDSVFVIDFGVAIEDFPVTLKVENAQGLTSIDVTASDRDVYTQFVIKGGSENLPSDYPYPNLQLDEDPSSTPPILANSMIKLPDLYSRWGKSIKELTYEDIKPSRTGTVTSISENILKFTDSDLIGAAWSPVGGTIHFVSGHLIGFTFNCQDFNSVTGEITIESAEENNGFVLPSPTDSYYRINELDKYNVAGVSLPSSYITAAKTALKERALLGIDYWSQPRMQYAITIDPKIISVEIVPNMGFHIEHSALGIDKVINVQQVVYDLSKEPPYDIESILISDLKTDDSRADATHRQIATTAHRLDDADKTSSSIKTVIKNLDTYIDGAFADGLVSEAEAKAIEKYINIVNSQKSDIDAQFTALYANSYLSGDPKTNLNAAKAALNTATTNLLSSINTAIADGAASEAEKADVDSKFTAFNSALSTYQTRVEEAKAAIEAAIETAANNYTNGQLSDYAETVTSSINGLQSQIDGVVDSWFYAYTPTTSNYPASEWTTTELKQRHVGDTFTNTQAYVDEATTPDAGKSWRWVNNSSVYSWTPIADSDAVKALLAASTAQDTADGKRRVFTTTPTPPYDKDDLWSGGSSGDLKISTTTRAVGSSYVAGDWVLATKYTDDTAADAAAAAAAAAQSAADDAQDAADAANTLLTNIASDSKLTASEKQAAKKEWDIIQAEKTKNDTQADLYSVSKTAYTNAYNALSSYLSTLLSNLTTTSDITGSEFRGKFKDYYNARTDLLNAISNAATAAAKAYTDGQLSDYAEVVTGSLGDLQNQIDGNITTWFYAYVPTLSNTPASDWTTTETKNQHLGDLFYDTETGYCYRFQLSGETYSWVKITDTDVTKALADAAAAQDTADNKRRVFVATPTTPYEVGDLWTGGESGDLKRCKVERLTGAYNASDWELATKYTDNTEAINAKRDAVNAAKEQADAIYTKVYANAYLTGDPKTNLNTAKTAFDTAVSELLSALSTGTDVENKIFAYDSATSTLYSKIQDAQEAISSAIKSASESAAKNYALAQDLLLKEKTDAYADGVATAAEEAAIEAAQLKVDAAKLVWEAYADGVVSDEEAARIADAQAKYEAALNYADSLASDSSDETDTKVAAAKNALATKFGYTDWAAMEAAVSLVGGLTTSSGLINANVIDVQTLAALDAFIEELVVIKLETAVDEDGTKVRIDADAVDGRAGVLLEESTGTRGVKLYYKASSGAPILYLYSTNTGELLEFLANRMKFSKGTTKDITIDSDSTILQLRSGTSYAQITPTSLRVDGLATAPVGKGHFWVDTSTGIVHWGIVTPPTVTYSFDIQKTYPAGRSDIAASGGTATFTVKLITTTDGIPDAGVLVDLDTGYPSVTSSPTGTSFSITRTGTGTYSITAASRGTVEDSGTAAVISVKYTPSGATQQSTSFNILQEANSKTKTDEDTGITLSISTIYNCPASGDTWIVTASGESGGREEYTYTSGASEWVSLGGTPIMASLISITTSGTGLSGSGTGAGTSVTWANRETTTGERRSGTITASYSGESVNETVYQQKNEVLSTSNHVIESVSLNGVNGNVEVDADATYIDPDVRLSYTETYTSGATNDYRSIINDVNYCGISVSGTGFSITGYRVNITENTGSSTRNGTLTITYKDATPVQRTITQAAASATTYQILGEITYSSGSQIPASGGTATLTVTKQTYINGVHQSASDVLIDCDSGYPYLGSQPTGCDVSITRTTTGTYSVSAESRGTTVNSGTEIEIDLASTVEGSLKTDSVIVIQQANALVSSTGYAITSVTLDGVNDDIYITKYAQSITVLGSGTYTKTYTSGATESANFNLGAGDISVSGLGFSYSNFTISVTPNYWAERTCTVTASYSGASNVTRTITQAMGVVAPSLSLDTYSISGEILTMKASILSAGGGTITACGFERGYTSSLGTDVSASTVQSGQFTADVSVVAGQTIYWRAYATNEAGTTYTTITNYTHSGTPIEE